MSGRCLFPSLPHLFLACQHKPCYVRSACDLRWHGANYERGAVGTLSQVNLLQSAPYGVLDLKTAADQLAVKQKVWMNLYEVQGIEIRSFSLS